MKRLLTFAIILGSSSFLRATTISNPSIFGVPGVNVSFGPSLLGGTVTSATTCFVGFCPGQNVPGPGPDYVVTDPLTVRLTNFDTVCTFNSCLGNGLSSGVFFVLPEAGSANVTFHIDGTGPPNNASFSVTLLFEIDNVLAFPFVPFPLPTDSSGNFALNMNLGTVSWGAGALLLVDPETFISSSTFDQRFIIPSSLDVTLTSTGVPEPATFFGGGSGLLLLLLARKRA